MIGWKRLKRPRKGCTQIVLERKGRGKHLYLVLCGDPAPWVPRRGWARRHRFCEFHRRLQDYLIRCAQESATRLAGFQAPYDYAQGM